MKVATDPVAKWLGQVRATLIAFFIAATGGAIFSLIGVPLPWALGALTAAALASILFDRWPMPRGARTVARPVVGVLAGSAFTTDLAAQVVGWWGEILLIGAYTILISAIGFFVIRRLARRDAATAFFSAIPGGLGELSLLGDQYGGQVRTIALVHSIRIVSVVFLMPFILMPETRVTLDADGMPEARDLLLLAAAGVGGYLLGRYGRFPGGELVAAMVLSALVHATGLTSAAPPAILVILAQILIGGVTGARFSGTTMRQLRETGLLAVGWSALLLSSAAACACVATLFSDMPYGALLLAMAPGGTAEMIVIALSLGIDVAFVALCQVFRIFLALTLAPLIFAIINEKARPPPEG